MDKPFRRRDLLGIRDLTAAEIDLMQRLRAAFDPSGISNPGKMFPGGDAPALVQHGLHPLEAAGLLSRE